MSAPRIVPLTRPSAPDEDILGALGEAMDQAVRGELVGLLIVKQYRGRDAGCAYTSVTLPTCHAQALIGEVALAQHALTARLYRKLIEE